MANLNLLLFHVRRRASIINPSQTLAAFVRSSFSSSSSSSSSPSSSIRRPWALADVRLDAPSLKLASPFVPYKEFCTFEPTSEGVIPPELLKSATVPTADRSLGEYADLVTRVTNFQNEDKGLMVLAGDVFDVPIRKDIIHRVVRWQLAKRRQSATLSDLNLFGYQT